MTAKAKHAVKETDYTPPETTMTSKTDVPIFDTPASIQIISKPLIQELQIFHRYAVIL